MYLLTYLLISFPTYHFLRLYTRIQGPGVIFCASLFCAPLLTSSVQVVYTGWFLLSASWGNAPHHISPPYFCQGGKRPNVPSGERQSLPPGARAPLFFPPRPQVFLPKSEISHLKPGAPPGKFPHQVRGQVGKRENFPTGKNKALFPPPSIDF